MSDVTRILSQIEHGDPQAAEKLLPLVYDELRKLAAVKLAQEKPGQTLQATALVHEAYIKLVDVDNAQIWNSRGQFFCAAAEAMRRIIVDIARHKKADKRGGDRQKISLEDAGPFAQIAADDLILLDETLQELGQQDPLGKKLVELRYFAGLSVEKAAEALGISNATAYRHWSFARAWLHCLIGRTGRLDEK